MDQQKETPTLSTSTTKWARVDFCRCIQVQIHLREGVGEKVNSGLVV